MPMDYSGEGKYKGKESLVLDDKTEVLYNAMVIANRNCFHQAVVRTVYGDHRLRNRNVGVEWIKKVNSNIR